MSKPEIERKFTYGELWQIGVTLIGGLGMLILIWHTMDSSIALAKADIKYNKKQIEENRETIQKIADLRNLVTELKTNQENQNKRFDDFIAFLKEREGR